LTHSALLIRLATAADIPELLTLDRQAPTAAHWSPAQYDVAVSGCDRLTLVIAENSSILAFLVVRRLGAEWEVENIAVSGSYRRRGLATQLLSRAIDLARLQKAALIFLEVRESNLPARTLYEKCGFLPAGARPRYYVDPEENAIIYRLSLG
jgi:ribosomal-protein-alanine acetyltransferase